MTLRTLTIGNIFYIAAAIILFIGGIGSPVIPSAGIWGLFCIALGHLFGDTPARPFW
jgi:fatty acid desaturase